MGNKSFNDLKFKTFGIEVGTRVQRKRVTDQNAVIVEKKKISETVQNGDIEGALIRIDSLINTEEHILALEILLTFINQLKEKRKQIGSYGVTEDLKEGANGVVYASKRLDVKNIEDLANMLKSVMNKSDFLEAQNGSGTNNTVKEKLQIRPVCNAEKWVKLIEIGKNSDIKLKVNKSIKRDVNEYGYRLNIDNPLEEQTNIDHLKLPETDVENTATETNKTKIKSSKTEKKKDKKSKKEKEEKKSKKDTKNHKSADSDQEYDDNELLERLRNLNK